MIVIFCEAALLFTCLMSVLLTVLILLVSFNGEYSSFSSRWITLTAHCRHLVQGISFCLTVSVRKLCDSSLTELTLGQGPGCCNSSGGENSGSTLGVVEHSWTVLEVSFTPHLYCSFWPYIEVQTQSTSLLVADCAV